MQSTKSRQIEQMGITATLSFWNIWLFAWMFLVRRLQFFEITNFGQPKNLSCHENGLIKTIPTTPNNLCGLSPVKTFTVD